MGSVRCFYGGRATAAGGLFGRRGEGGGELLVEREEVLDAGAVVGKGLFAAARCGKSGLRGAFDMLGDLFLTLGTCQRLNF